MTKAQLLGQGECVHIWYMYDVSPENGVRDSMFYVSDICVI